MTLTALLTQDLQVIPRDPGGTDRYNNPTDTDGTPVAVKGYVQPVDSVEVTIDEETVTADARAFLHPDVVIRRQDHLIDAAGRRWEVVGIPAVEASPRAGHHINVTLRHVAW